MASITGIPELHGSWVFREPRSLLRWEETVLWPVRRPYPIEVACPVCLAYVRCSFLGRQRCPSGHEFGQRAFWSGGAATCWLLIEDIGGGRTFIYPDAPLVWHDDARKVPV